MITLNEIQKKLSTEIKNSGMTQTAIAEKLCIRQQTISQYISGRAMPALDTFANLCVLLDLDANDILCINQQHNIQKNKTQNNININGNFNNNGKITFK